MRCPPREVRAHTSPHIRPSGTPVANKTLSRKPSYLKPPLTPSPPSLIHQPVPNQSLDELVSHANICKWRYIRKWKIKFRSTLAGEELGLDRTAGGAGAGSLCTPIGLAWRQSLTNTKFSLCNRLPFFNLFFFSSFAACDVKSDANSFD